MHPAALCVLQCIGEYWQCRILDVLLCTCCMPAAAAVCVLQDSEERVMILLSLVQLLGWNN
jgi:hypothetical protein